MTPEQKIEECTHSPIYDKQTGGSKCKKCGVLLNDFNQEYSEVSPSEIWEKRIIDWYKMDFREWYINTSGQQYMPYEVLAPRIEEYVAAVLLQYEKRCDQLNKGENKFFEL